MIDIMNLENEKYYAAFLLGKLCKAHMPHRLVRVVYMQTV
jgi:hypothetical protein